MKKWLCSILVLVGLCSTAQAEIWSLRFPEPALVPSYAKATYLSRMHERHGGSHLGMQDYTLNFPIVDGRHSHVGKWWYNIQANISATIMDVGGSLDLRRDALFDFAIPFSVIHPINDGKEKLTLTLMPHYAGDMVKSAHAWDLAIVGDYYIQYSKTFGYSVGLAVSPRFAQYAAVPYLSFTWQATPEWMVRLRGYQLSALYQVNDRLRIGPALSNEGGQWMVSTPNGQRIFRVRSLMAAVMAEYNFAPAGKTKRLLTLALGSTIATYAEFCNRTARKDTISGHHYKPGFAASIEVDFRF